MSSVLVIEDDQEIREAIKEVLDIEGYQVATVKNGQEGLNYLRTANPMPRLVILDIMMPVMNGFEFLEHQAKDERISGLPTAILSADGAAIKKAKSLGAKYALKKPVDLDELINLISSLTTT